MFVKICDSDVEPKTFIEFITEVAEERIEFVIVSLNSSNTGLIQVVEKGLDDGDCNLVSQFECFDVAKEDLELLTESFNQEKVACLFVECYNECFEDKYIF